MARVVDSDVLHPNKLAHILGGGVQVQDGSHVAVKAPLPGRWLVERVVEAAQDHVVEDGSIAPALAESGASARASGQLGLGLRRLSLEQQRAASDERLRAQQIRAAERLGQLQEAYINAKTPEEQAAIASQMRAYSGKDEADWKVQVTPATKNLDGSTTAGSVIRYNSRTGDVQKVGGVGNQASTPSEHNINALRANPKLRDQFDQQFGSGAAARYLG